MRVCDLMQGFSTVVSIPITENLVETQEFRFVELDRGLTFCICTADAVVAAVT